MNCFIKRNTFSIINSDKRRFKFEEQKSVIQQNSFSIFAKKCVDFNMDKKKSLLNSSNTVLCNVMDK